AAPSSRCARPFTPRRRPKGAGMITRTPKLNRRSFVIGSAAVGAGLALGLKIPFGASVVRAQDGSPEVTAWVVLRPDDTVVIRIARSEMGQGTLTGLAQMVAEELECDWSKVKTEYPTPGQSVKRKRAWGDFSTGGSRGIRDSHQYVREGGATARIMLIPTIKDCAVLGGKVKSYEAATVCGMPGVRHVVKVGDSAVAVVADTWWQAKTALDALPIVWDEGENAKVSSASIAAMLKEGL